MKSIRASINSKFDKCVEYLANRHNIDINNLSNKDIKLINKDIHKITGGSACGFSLHLADTGFCNSGIYNKSGYSTILHEGAHAGLDKLISPNSESEIYINKDLMREDAGWLSSKLNFKDLDNEELYKETGNSDVLNLTAAVDVKEASGFSRFISGLGPTIIYAPLGYALFKHGIKKVNSKTLALGSYLLALSATTGGLDTDVSIEGLGDEIKKVYPALGDALINLPGGEKYILGMTIAVGIAAGIYKTGKFIRSKVSRKIKTNKSNST